MKESRWVSYIGRRQVGGKGAKKPVENTIVIVGKGGMLRVQTLSRVAPRIYNGHERCEKRKSLALGSGLDHLVWKPMYNKLNNEI